MSDLYHSDGFSALVDLYATYQKRERAERIAKRLFDSCGTTERLLHESLDRLCALSGLGECDAAFLKLCIALDSRRRTERFRFGEIPTEQQIKDYFIGLFLGSTEENIYLLSFDDKGRAIACDLVAEGTINSASVTARRLLDFAVSRCVHSVILAHNHPCGTTAASNEDLRLTGNYSGLFASVGICLREHYIVAGEQCEGIMNSMGTELHSAFEAFENAEI